MRHSVAYPVIPPRYPDASALRRCRHLSTLSGRGLSLSGRRARARAGAAARGHAVRSQQDVPDRADVERGALTHVSPCGARSCWPKPARRLSQRAKRHAQQQQAEGLAQTAACFHGAIVGTVSSVCGHGARHDARGITRRTGGRTATERRDDGRLISGSIGSDRWARAKLALGTRRPHLHRGWAHPAQIYTGTGPTRATSAPGLGQPRPHLRRGWAHPHRHLARTAPAAESKPFEAPRGVRGSFLVGFLVLIWGTLSIWVLVVLPWGTCSTPMGYS